MSCCRQSWSASDRLHLIQPANVLDVAEASASSDVLITVGFSMGAPHALEAAIRNRDSVDAAVIFYGDAVGDREVLAPNRPGGWPSISSAGSR